MTTQANIQWDLLDPFPWYRQKRAEAPVFWDEQHQIWHVLRYDDVQRVLSDHATFSSEFGRRMGQESEAGIHDSLISSDPPRHRQLRTLVSQAFTPRAVDALAPRITQIVDELLDTVAGRGEMDLVWDFAYPLPVIVIAELLGIPPEQRDQFKHWSDAVVSGMSTRDDPTALSPMQAQREMAAYFAALIEERRRQPREDLISALLAAQIDGEHLELNALLGFCILLLIAGNETTTNLIGNALLCFNEAPEAMTALQRDPSLLPGAIEEVLRYRSPVQSMFRTVAKDVSLSGQELKAGQPVLAWLGSANRDERAFEQAHRFDIHRTPNRHLAFGYGIHFCLGAPLARLEARIALAALIERLPNLRRAAGPALAPMDSIIIYGVKSLPVQFTPAR